MEHKYFIIIGAQKSGTTALHSFLSEHSKIRMSTPKEGNFFVNISDENINYLDFFPNAEGKQWLGEASPIYMLRCQQAAHRIAAALPEVKLIASLRNPIERAYSQFHMLLQIGKANGDFSDALAKAEVIEYVADLDFDPTTGYPCQPVQTLLLYGQYTRQLQCFFKHFRREQLLVIRHEELMEEHNKTLERIFRFLDLDSVEIIARSVHKRNYPPLDSVLWHRLLQHLEPEIESLEALLGWDLTHWRHYPEII